MLKASLPPCGACKYQRKKCVNGCPFAPYFSSVDGFIEFSIVHKIFGASNVLKMLSDVEESRRQEAIRSILFEAQSRINDPINGCVSDVIKLQQQVTLLREDLATVKNQLIHTMTLYEDLLRVTYQCQQQQQSQSNINVAVQSPYSNNSFASTSFVNMNVNSSFDHLAMQTTPLMENLNPPQFFKLPLNEEQSMIPQVFNNNVPNVFP
ncbi:hypothetical protein Fmac_029471 [Flemingia macrophylla]|uniref:LOB domain-containing protein n=1 Tax=Flemingia macrophylla TaxID=520843 RepID=A0ABD1LAF1_9FABA